VIDCDRNPNTTYPETLSVTIDVGQTIDSGARLYKVSDAGQWSLIDGAVITGQTVTYSITDDGDLDQDKTPGTLRDPVALAVPSRCSYAGPGAIALLAAGGPHGLSGLVGLPALAAGVVW
jgi:hypothetical protein